MVARQAGALLTDAKMASCRKLGRASGGCSTGTRALKLTGAKRLPPLLARTGDFESNENRRIFGMRFWNHTNQLENDWRNLAAPVARNWAL